MPFTGGSFSLYTPGNPVVTGTTISSTWANNTLSDIATGLSTTILKNGNQTLTANIPFGGFKITGLGNATALTDGANLYNVQVGSTTYLSSVAGTNTITATATPTPAYVVGQRFTFVPANTNTGATTLNISSVGAGAVQWAGAALTGGELVANTPVTVLVTATTPVFEIINATQFPDTRALVVGGTDATKKARFEVDGLTTGTTRVYTLQDSDDTLVGRATTDTLSNKTLVAPVLGTPASGALENCTNTVVLVAESATTSGTTVNITGIPAGTKRIVLMLDGVSTNGTSGLMVQIGPSGGVENTGYTGGVSVGTSATAFTTGFGLYESLSAGDTYVGQMVISLQDSSNNVWVATSNVMNSSAANAVRMSAGRKAIAGVITQLTLTTVSGDTFDAGAIAIQYER